MKALRFHGVGRFGLEELPMPEPGPGEVRLRPAAAGVCGTDVHILDGSFPCRTPVVLGHEMAGFVDAVGRGVLDIREGDLVTVEPHRFCGLCRYCRTGREHLCLRKEAWGVHIDGGMAEAVVVSETVAYRLPSGTDPRIGALTEPLACCIHAIDRLDPRPGLSLAIFGAGPAGLIMLTLAHRSGVRPIVVLEPDAGRREAALTFGADAAIDPLAPGWREQALAVAHADGFDFVLEAVGSPRVLEQGISIAARGAHIEVFGVANPGDTATIRPEEIFAKELTILGTVINPSTHHRAVELLPALGLERLGILTFPLEQHAEAFRAQHERRAGKIQFAPQLG